MDKKTDKLIPDDRYVKAGEVNDFLSLYVANHKRLYGFIVSLVGNWSDAEDLLQETAGVLWDKFGDYQTGTDFAAWGMKIARYRIMAFHRKQKSSQVQFDGDLLELLTQESGDVLCHMDSRITALQGCLDKLGDREREFIRLHYDDEMTHQAMSKVTGKPLHTIYRMMSKIHDVLLKCIRRTIVQEGA